MERKICVIKCSELKIFIGSDKQEVSGTYKYHLNSFNYHLNSFSMMFSIFIVALIAASVWSASRARVRYDFSL